MRRLLLSAFILACGVLALAVSAVPADEQVASGPMSAAPCVVCKPVAETKKKTVYDCKVQDFCLPVPAGPWRLFFSHDSECAEARKRRVLVKKSVPEPCPTTKWVPEKTAAACPPPAATAATNPAARPAER